MEQVTSKWLKANDIQVNGSLSDFTLNAANGLGSQYFVTIQRALLTSIAELAQQVPVYRMDKFLV